MRITVNDENIEDEKRWKKEGLLFSGFLYDKKSIFIYGYKGSVTENHSLSLRQRIKIRLGRKVRIHTNNLTFWFN